MKKLLLIILLIPSILYAKQTPHDALIFVETPCYGSCAAYEFMLFSDGTMIFIGKQNVEYEGLYKFSLGKKVFGEVLKLTEKYEFQKFNEFYGTKNQNGCKEYWSDNPSTMISLRLSGNDKTVKHYHGCKGFDRERELMELQNKIKELLNIKQYIVSAKKQPKK